MAAGGVGLAAIELCKRVEEVEIFGTASAGKHEFLRKAGVHHRIDYRTQDYAAEVMRLTGGKGVNIVLDALGGPDWEKGYNLLRPGGPPGLLRLGEHDRRREAQPGAPGHPVPGGSHSPMELMDKNRSISGVNMGHLWGELDLMNGHLEKAGGSWPPRGR